VTDDNGNTKTKTFPITVANVAPTVDAGADTTTDWGRPVSFVGQASDPGSVDQSSLQYSWDFGDGSPSAAGPNASHTYATPAAGGYDVTLTVCDKDAACASDVRHVSVTKRDTTTTYQGDTSGAPSVVASLRASLVDEYGQPVTGRTVRFQVGSDGPYNSSTDSNGIATRSYRPTLAPGSYVGSSTFTGDQLYNASSAASTFKVVTRTALIYYGDFLGRPNRTVELRALLVDRAGNPLPGRAVTFALGDQTASATTDVRGVAATSLRLDQRGGLYALTSTWTPSGADATTYAGSSLTLPFLLLPR
jgi:PKD repeat protein